MHPQFPIACCFKVLSLGVCLFAVAPAANLEKPSTEPSTSRFRSDASPFLDEANEYLRQASILIKNGDGGDTAGLWKLAKASLDNARAVLREAKDTDPGVEGDEFIFSVEEQTCNSIPSSFGWIQIVVGDVIGNQGPVEIRTYDGETLVPMKSVKSGEKIQFEYGNIQYPLTVDRIRDVMELFTGHDSVSLVLKRGAVPATSSRTMKTGEELPTQRESRPRRPVIATILELAGEILTSIDLDEVERTVLSTKPDDRDAALQQLDRLRARLHDCAYVLYHLRNFDSSFVTWACLPEDLALVKAKVASVTPKYKNSSVAQDMTLEILEVRAQGKRYPSRTQYGRRFPGTLRDDTTIGSVLTVDNTASPGTQMFMKDGVYWLALTAPTALKAIVREYGANGTTKIAFGMRVE